jgi:phosphate/sulfate permease
MTDSPQPTPEDSPAEFTKWFSREFDRGNLGVIIASGVMFAIIVATLAIQIGLVIVLWVYVYPTAVGATEKTVVIVSLFGGLAVFLGELSTVFQQSLVFQFLSRPNRRRPVRKLDSG